ncbi:MBL fold metallo-hydrolase [Candidatus Thorarchaeota archaeon]|nr:MAG: MBL fold metallo-hydrolase [Candidatus Thorarchaeota archaeon]
MLVVEDFNDTVKCIKTATIQDGEPIMWVYSYLAHDVMFDAGCANAASDFKRIKNEYDISRIFISHAHEDHFGGLSVLADKCEVFAPKLAHDELMHPTELDEFFQFVWGQPKGIQSVNDMPKSFQVQELNFKVIELPGHHQHMVGFHEPEKGWLFSADAVPLPSKKYIAMPDENIPMMVDTMKRISELDLEVLFDAHKGPIIDPQEHIKRRIDYLTETQQRVRDLNRKGMTVKEIVAEMGWEGPWYLGLTEGRFGIDFLVKSMLHDKAQEQ